MIDNPLWAFIMHICNPKYKNDVIDELKKFINSEFNLASILYYVRQQAVIIIDPYTSCNRKRMQQRGKGGDLFRCRIENLATIQSIVYYSFARLFGWRVYTVPYTEDKQIDQFRYNQIADEIFRYFGMQKKNTNIFDETYGKFAKPCGDYTLDFTYAKAVGIYK